MIILLTTINEEEARKHKSNCANIGVPLQVGPAAGDPKRVYERNKQRCCEDVIHVEVHTLPEEMIRTRTPPCDCTKERNLVLTFHQSIQRGSQVNQRCNNQLVTNIPKVLFNG